MARHGNRLLRAYLTATFSGLLFLELATPSFIDQYDARPNGIFLEYLVYPKEVTNTLLAGYSYQLAAALFVIVVATLGLRRILSRSLELPQRRGSLGSRDLDVRHLRAPTVPVARRRTVALR
ncbi:hypothetical protein D3C83_39470 [compost metagenome]